MAILTNTERFTRNSNDADERIINTLIDYLPEKYGETFEAIYDVTPQVTKDGYYEDFSDLDKVMIALANANDPDATILPRDVFNRNFTDLYRGCNPDLTDLIDIPSILDYDLIIRDAKDEYEWHYNNDLENAADAVGTDKWSFEESAPEAYEEFLSEHPDSSFEEAFETYCYRKNVEYSDKEMALFAIKMEYVTYEPEYISDEKYGAYYLETGPDAYDIGNGNILIIPNISFEKADICNAAISDLINEQASPYRIAEKFYKDFYGIDIEMENSEIKITDIQKDSNSDYFTGVVEFAGETCGFEYNPETGAADLHKYSQPGWATGACYETNLPKIIEENIPYIIDVICSEVENYQNEINELIPSDGHTDGRTIDNFINLLSDMDKLENGRDIVVDRDRELKRQGSKIIADAFASKKLSDSIIAQTEFADNPNADIVILTVAYDLKTSKLSVEDLGIGKGDGTHGVFHAENPGEIKIDISARELETFRNELGRNSVQKGEER